MADEDKTQAGASTSVTSATAPKKDYSDFEDFGAVGEDDFDFGLLGSKTDAGQEAAPTAGSGNATAPSSVDDDFSPFVPPTPAEDAPAVPSIKDLPSAAERIAKTIAGMPGQKKLLLHIIDYARVKRTVPELEAEITAFEAHQRSVYGPQTVVKLLANAGAIRQVPQPGQEKSQADGGLQETGDVQAATEAQTAADAQGADATQAAAAAENPAPEAPAASEGETVADTGAGPIEVDTPQGDYLVVRKPEPLSFIATPDAIAALESYHPHDAFAKFIEENEIYAPLFVRVLVACDEDGGLAKKKIDALVDDDPICKSPRRFSGFFIDHLEEADALEFDGTWHTTQAGRALLDEGGVLSGY